MFVYALHHLPQNPPPTSALRRVLYSLTYIKSVPLLVWRVCTFNAKKKHVGKTSEKMTWETTRRNGVGKKKVRNELSKRTCRGEYNEYCKWRQEAEGLTEMRGKEFGLPCSSADSIKGWQYPFLSWKFKIEFSFTFLVLFPKRSAYKIYCA